MGHLRIRLAVVGHPSTPDISSPYCRKIAASVVLLCALALTADSQQAPPPIEQAQPDVPETQPPATFFEHSQTAKWWVSGQANFIFQANGSFYAQYSGPNSFKNVSENAL